MLCNAKNAASIIAKLYVPSRDTDVLLFDEQTTSRYRQRHRDTNAGNRWQCRSSASSLLSTAFFKNLPLPRYGSDLPSIRCLNQTRPDISWQILTKVLDELVTYGQILTV